MRDEPYRRLLTWQPETSLQLSGSPRTFSRRSRLGALSGRLRWQLLQKPAPDYFKSRQMPRER